MQSPTQPIADFFDSSDFMPHGHCFLWQPQILWLHVVSDAAIALAYFSIPAVMIYLLRKRRDWPFHFIPLLFAAFILLCGTTHLLSIWVLWHPDYALEGVVKALTAVASIATAFMLAKLTPLILRLPSAAELGRMNQQLREEGASREARLLRDQEMVNTALAASEERHALVIKTLSLGIWDWNTQTNDLYWSPRFGEMIGYAPSELADRYNEWESRLHPDDREHVTTMLHNHLKKLNPYDAEYRLLRRDGTYIWIHAKGQAVWDRNGIALRMVGSIEDITWRKEAGQERERYVAALKRSNQELDDFAYIASHDLKEPLRGLSNNARFLIEDYGSALDAAGHKRLNRMTYLCERMEQLVNDLLYFSRLGRQELAVQRTDLNAVVRDIESMMETTLQEANARVEIVNPLPIITCDLPRITEVYRNLISNAVKYNDKTEKRVEIGFEIKDAEHVFFVRDNGIGIPEQFHQDVFRIFKRLNDEDDTVKGTGVGLTFVKKIIERHRGRIWIVSQPGQSTTFYFTIPETGEAA